MPNNNFPVSLPRVHFLKKVNFRNKGRPVNMTVLEKVPVYMDTLPDTLLPEEGGHLIDAVQLDPGEAGVPLALP